MVLGGCGIVCMAVGGFGWLWDGLGSCEMFLGGCEIVCMAVDGVGRLWDGFG